MSFVKRCPGCGDDFRGSVETCPECGEALLWEAEGSGEQRRTPDLRDSFADPGGEARLRQPPLPPSPDLETVVEVDLHDAKALGLRLDAAGVPFRLEMLEPPENSYSAALGIPNAAGAYAVRVAPRDLARAEAEWDGYLRKTAPGPESDPAQAWSSDAPPPIDRGGSSCLGVVFLLILGSLAAAWLVPFFA